MQERGGGTGALALTILFVVLVGAPLVAWVWETLNRLLGGYVEPLMLALSLPALALLWLLLRWLARAVERWAEARDSHVHPDASAR